MAKAVETGTTNNEITLLMTLKITSRVFNKLLSVDHGEQEGIEVLGEVQLLSGVVLLERYYVHVNVYEDVAREVYKLETKQFLDLRISFILFEFIVFKFHE